MIPLNLMEAIFDVPEEYLCKFTTMRRHRENQPSLKAYNLNNTDHALAILTIPKFKYSVPWYPHIYDNTALVSSFSSTGVRLTLTLALPARETSNSINEDASVDRH